MLNQPFPMRWWVWWVWGDQWMLSTLPLAKLSALPPIVSSTGLVWPGFSSGGLQGWLLQEGARSFPHVQQTVPASSTTDLPLAQWWWQHLWDKIFKKEEQQLRNYSQTEEWKYMRETSLQTLKPVGKKGWGSAPDSPAAHGVDHIEAIVSLKPTQCHAKEEIHLQPWRTCQIRGYLTEAVTPQEGHVGAGSWQNL